LREFPVDPLEGLSARRHPGGRDIGLGHGPDMLVLHPSIRRIESAENRHRWAEQGLAGCKALDADRWGRATKGRFSRLTVCMEYSARARLSDTRSGLDEIFRKSLATSIFFALFGINPQAEVACSGTGLPSLLSGRPVVTMSW